MQTLKWYAISLLVGAILGASTVLFFMYRPATTTITELRNESELAAQQYRTETAEYNNLLSETGKRINQLANDLGRAAAAHNEDVERIKWLEAQARSLEELIISVQESSSRSYEYNRGIRSEAGAALSELREYSATFKASINISGEGASLAED